MSLIPYFRVKINRWAVVAVNFSLVNGCLPLLVWNNPEKEIASEMGGRYVVGSLKSCLEVSLLH